MQLAVEAGAKRILIPSENKRDVAEVPDAALIKIQWQFYDSDPCCGHGAGIELTLSAGPAALTSKPTFGTVISVSTGPCRRGVSPPRRRVERRPPTGGRAYTWGPR